jgi:hypothetical protein
VFAASLLGKIFVFTASTCALKCEIASHSRPVNTVRQIECERERKSEGGREEEKERGRERGKERERERERERMNSVFSLVFFCI